MKNKILLVYPGLGKTYTSKNNPNVLDIKLSQFQDLNYSNYSESEIEKNKGSKVEIKPNPLFPQNIISFLKGVDEGKIVCMALKQPNIDFLVENNFDFVFILPSEDRINQLAKDYIARGNNQKVVSRNIENLKDIEWIKKYKKEIFYIKTGEYLQDLLKEKNWCWYSIFNKGLVQIVWYFV